MKVTQVKLKKKLQGLNSGMDEAKNQINDLEYKEEKKNIQSEQQEEKKESKPAPKTNLGRLTNL